MRQMSLFSALARSSAPEDLAGLLCTQGQVHGFGRGTAARVSIVVDDGWRAAAIAMACAERDLATERGRTGAGHHWVRTPFAAALRPLACAWTRGAMKAVPEGWSLDGAALRLWVLAAGAPDGRGFLLGLDPRAPDTHLPLAHAAASAGLVSGSPRARAAGPALRVAGRRRLARLFDLVGEPPPMVPPDCWPG